MKIKIEDIEIGVRQRRELGDLTDLDSMADPQVGQIQPIIVWKKLDGKFELVAGMRRLSKAKQLGWAEVEVVEKGAITPKQKELMEFFEDFGRKERTWQEECLATHKLFHILRFEKREEGQVWTVRGMEKFCGENRQTINFKMRIAEKLLDEPRDDEMWNCPNRSAAEKLLLSRSNKATNEELNRRRMLAAQAEAQSQLRIGLPAPENSKAPEGVEVIEEPAGLEVLEDGSAESPVSNPDPTPAPEPAIVVDIYGRNRLFDGKDKDFGLVIQYGPSLALLEGTDTLLPDGWLAYFSTANEPSLLPDMVWNRVSPIETKMPFYANAQYGYFFPKNNEKLLGPFKNPSSGCFTAMDYSGGKELAREIVHALVKKLTVEGQTVLCLSGVNPCHVVECGRVPVFYEPDPVIYAERLEQLKEEYRAVFPNIEFKHQP